MTHICHAHFFLWNAATVIGHADKGSSAVLNLNGHCGGASINGIFQKLLYDRGWTFNNFAGCNFIDGRFI